MARDLLGAPPPPEQAPDNGVILLRVVLVTPGAASAPVGALARFAGPIGPIGAPAAVAGQLPADRAAVAAQLVSDLCRIEPLLSQVRNNIPLRGGELLILHYGFSLLGRREKPGVSQVASFNGERVALSI